MTGINIDVTKKELLEQERHNDIIKTEEAERQRISHDLHDGLGQKIAAANMYMNTLEGYVNDQLDEDGLSIFEVSKKLISESAKETRLVSHNIMPQSLKQFGLEETIEEMLSNYQKINKEFLIKFASNLNKFRFDSNKELSIFRALQESVNNAIKHSKSKELICELTKEGNVLCAKVIDKGVGFDIEKLKYTMNELNDVVQKDIKVIESKKQEVVSDNASIIDSDK